MLPYHNNKHNEVLYDTSLFIYICVKHFGMAHIKFVLNYPDSYHVQIGASWNS